MSPHLCMDIYRDPFGTFAGRRGVYRVRLCSDHRICGEGYNVVAAIRNLIATAAAHGYPSDPAQYTAKLDGLDTETLS